MSKEQLVDELVSSMKTGGAMFQAGPPKKSKQTRGKVPMNQKKLHIKPLKTEEKVAKEMVKALTDAGIIPKKNATVPYTPLTGLFATTPYIRPNPFMRTSTTSTDDDDNMPDYTFETPRRRFSDEDIKKPPPKTASKTPAPAKAAETPGKKKQAQRGKSQAHISPGAMSYYIGNSNIKAPSMQYKDVIKKEAKYSPPTTRKKTEAERKAEAKATKEGVEKELKRLMSGKGLVVQPPATAKKYR
jgi:hypothetical protein